MCKLNEKKKNGDYGEGQDQHEELFIVHRSIDHGVNLFGGYSRAACKHEGKFLHTLEIDHLKTPSGKI